MSSTDWVLGVYLQASLPLFFSQSIHMLYQPFLRTQRKEPGGPRGHHPIRNDGSRSIIDQKKNVAAGGQGVMLRVRMKGCHVDQLAAWCMPDSVVYREEVIKPVVVGEILMLEHPAALPASSILLDLPAHILKASRLLSQIGRA